MYCVYYRNKIVWYKSDDYYQDSKAQKEENIKQRYIYLSLLIESLIIVDCSDTRNVSVVISTSHLDLIIVLTAGNHHT